MKQNKKIEVIDIRTWLDDPVKKEQKALVFIRHDVDISLDRTEKMISLEAKLNIPSCYFFRENAQNYSFNEAKPLMEKIVDSSNFDLGYHYATLRNTGGDLKSAPELFKREVEMFREINPNLTMIAGHGDRFRNRNIVINNIVNLDELNLISAYDLPNDHYLSEAGGGHHFYPHGEKMTFFDKLQLLENPPTGTLIQILVHPDWWF